MTPIPENPFQIPADGWYQISALGEFPHQPTGLTQIVDEEACGRMVDHFQTMLQQPNFAGVLIDFDHFSLDGDKPSEAAGWIMGLEKRPDGLWAQIRWSDRGQQAVTGGRYRFLSPVWRQDECDDLGNKRVRPKKLCNAALTNDPNIRGMVPLSNRAIPAAPPAPTPTLRLSPETEIDLMRATLLVNGIYFKIPSLMRNRVMTEEQRKAMFARLHGAGGGGGGGGRNGGDTNTSSTSAQDPAPTDTSQPDTSSDSSSATTPSTEDTMSSAPIPSYNTNEPTRQSATRIQEYTRQIEELQSQRTAAPSKPDYELVDLNEAKKEAMKSGANPLKVVQLLKELEQENRKKKDAMHEIEQRARQIYPGNPAKQKKYVDKELDDIQKAYQRQLDDWNKREKAISDKITKLVTARNVENIRFREELYKIAQAGQRKDDATAERDQRQATAVEKRQAEKAAIEAKRKEKEAAAEQRRQQEKAARAEKEAQKKAEQDAKKNAPESTYKAEIAKYPLYWKAIREGRMEVARALFPKADHQANVQAYKDRVPEGSSRDASAKFEKEFKLLQTRAP